MPRLDAWRSGRLKACLGRKADIHLFILPVTHEGIRHESQL